MNVVVAWVGQRTAMSTPDNRSRSDQREFWKVAFVAYGIAREQSHTCHERMGADVEVGHGRGFLASLGAVRLECLTGEECRVPRQRFALERKHGQCRFKIGRALKSW